MTEPPIEARVSEPTIGLDRWLSLPARRPWWVLLTAGILLVAGILLALRLEPDNSLEAMIGDQSEAALALERMHEEFHFGDNLMVLVSLPEDTLVGDDIEQQRRRARQLISYADRLRTSLTRDDAATLVEAVMFESSDQAEQFTRHEMVPAALHYLSDEQFERLQERLGTQSIREQIERNEALMLAPGPTGDAMARAILQDPLRLYGLLSQTLRDRLPGFRTWSGSRAFLSEDTRHLLMNVYGTRSASDLTFTETFMDLVRDRALTADPGNLTIHYGGSYAMAELAGREIRLDMIRSMVGSVVLLQLAFLLVYRRWSSFPLIVLPVAVGVAVAFGVFSISGATVSPMAAVIGGILAGLGVDYGIHYLSHFQDAAGEGDNVRRVTVVSRSLLLPLIAASVTSVLAFTTVGVSEVPALRSFAWLGAMGLAGACIAALMVLPAMLTLGVGGGKGGTRIHLQPLVTAIARHRRAAAVTFSLALLAGGGLLLTRGDMDRWMAADLTALHPHPNPPMQTQERIMEIFATSPHGVTLMVEAPDPASLERRAAAVAQQLDTAGLEPLGFAQSHGVNTLLPDTPERIMVARRQAVDTERVLTDFHAALADSVFDPAAYEAYSGFLRALLSAEHRPDITTLTQYPDLVGLMLPTASLAPDDAPPTVTLMQALWHQKFRSRSERDASLAAIRTAVADVPGVTLTGVTVMSHDVEHQVLRSLRTLLPIAVVVVLIWLTVMFRSPRDAILAMLPAVVGMITVFVTLQLTDTRLNLINLLALPLLAGIGVDDGIFLIGAARRHRLSLGTNRHTDLLAEIAASAHAMTMTTITTSLAFGSLIFTSTPAIRSLGVVLGVGMVGCWAGAMFLLLPVLLRQARHHATVVTP